MEWTDDDVDDAEQIFYGHDGTRPLRESYRALMTSAVDLAAARCGVGIEAVFERIRHDQAGSDDISALSARFALLMEGIEEARARIATLEAELMRTRKVHDKQREATNEWAEAAARAEAERDTISQRLTEMNQRAQENWEKQEVERERLQAELTEAHATIARLLVASRELSEHADRTAGEPQP